VSGSGLWVARHAPVAVRGLCYGQHDIPVEVDHETGAARLAAQWEALGGAKVERIWTSPWERARGLAEALAARLGARVEVESRLAELSFGAWEGRPYAEIEVNDRERFHAWMADWEHLAPPEGESVPALVARIGQWRRAIEDHAGIAITHAGPIRTLRALARGVSYAAIVSEPVSWMDLERVG